MTLPMLLALAVVASPLSSPQQRGAPVPASTQGPGDPSALYDNQWRLTRLGGAEVVLKDAPREAHLVFFPGGNLNGADGCNAIRGGFETRGDSLTIKTPLMGT
ncbi:MAG: META domain-containing protein, partial [Acidobacteriota bacterium]|nr:META domain-containing protein [Acidobacteriota bacterium]